MRLEPLTPILNEGHGRTMLYLADALLVVAATFWIAVKVLDCHDLASLPRIGVDETAQFGIGNDNGTLLSGPSPGTRGDLVARERLGNRPHSALLPDSLRSPRSCVGRGCFSERIDREGRKSDYSIAAPA
jgi:hypothetical protein